MTKILALIFFLSVTFLSAQSQSVYELSFSFPNADGSIAYKGCFIDYNDGKGKLRLKFTAPAGRDSVLADFDVAEQYVDNNSNCFNGDRIYYKLQNPKYIESKDPGVKLPGYFCFVKDATSGLFEPFGVTNSLTDCQAQVVKFSAVAVKQQKDLTKEFVLSYFKVYDVFYRNIFVTNNSKDLTTSERNVKLFLLFVANVTDKEIGTADRKNMNDAIAFFRNVKDFLGIDTYIFDTITGKRLNKTNVENAIKTFFTPGPNDIVVFYYSGHGFRKEKDGRPAPYIDLRDEANTDYMANSLNLEDISVMIKSKGARLNLILSDCCNDNVTKTNPMAKDGALAGKKGLFDKFWNTQKCRDLFLNAIPSTLLATAASPYQLAISNAVFGGYFSNHFINTLETNLSLANKNPKVTWDDIFDQTVQQTETKSGRTWCNDEKTIKCNRQRPYKCISYGRIFVPCM